MISRGQACVNVTAKYVAHIFFYEYVIRYALTGIISTKAFNCLYKKSPDRSDQLGTVIADKDYTRLEAIGQP